MTEEAVTGAAGAASGRDVPHSVGQSTLHHKGRGVPSTHHGEAFGFCTSVEHLHGAQSEILHFEDAGWAVEDDRSGFFDGLRKGAD